jgi:hypothetical protein
MQNVREILNRKEQELERVRTEVQALRLIAPLLAEETDRVLTAAHLASPTKMPVQRVGVTEPAKQRAADRITRWP